MASWHAYKNRICTALLLGFVATQSMAVPVLSLTATPQPAVVGSTVSLDVRIADITDLYTWQFSLDFNPSVLRATGVTEGMFLSSGGITFFGGGTVNNTAGSIDFVFDSLLGTVPGVNGGGVLARIDFSVLAAGSSPVAFSDVLFLDSNSVEIPLVIQGLTVQAVPVPEPAAWLLFGAGLAALGVARRQKVA